MVGSDGPTHAGSFDITFLSTLPNFIVMAPSNQAELIRMIKTSSLINDFPSAFRYPRGTDTLTGQFEELNEIDIGKGYFVQEGNEIAILNLGTRLNECIEACKILKQSDIYPTLVDARFAKPIDTEIVDKILDNHKYLITIEEGSIGGFASHVMNYINNVRVKKTKTIIKNIFFPDKFIEHMKPEEQYEEIKMNVSSIVGRIRELLDDRIININEFNHKR